MADFPTSIHSATNPTSANNLSSPSHSLLHQSHEGEIIATQTKLGSGSATPSSGAVLVGNGAGTSTWDTSPGNIVLDTPTLNTPDLNGTELILDADADTSITADTDDQIDVKINNADDFRFAANNFSALSGSKITTDRIDELDTLTLYDANGNEYIAFSKTTSAVNYFSYANAATGNPPTLTSTGDDTNIGFKIATKGTGDFFINSQNWSGEWAAWTPTFTNWTIGSGGSAGTVAEYKQIGKTVHFRLKTILGTSGQSAGSIVSFTLPVSTHSDYGDGYVVGTGTMYDAGVAAYQAGVYITSTTEAKVVYAATNGNYAQWTDISSTTPFTWGSGDTIIITGTYEAP